MIQAANVGIGILGKVCWEGGMVGREVERGDDVEGGNGGRGGEGG